MPSPSQKLTVDTTPRLYPGGTFGQRARTVAAASPGKPVVKTEIASDGFSMLTPDSMYRSDEFHPGRREPRFTGLHNLADAVIERTLNPPRPSGRDAIRRAVLWDHVARSFRKAIAGIPSGSYVAVCSNSGPYDAELEDKHPADFVPGASCGILFVSMFRADETNISGGWIQVGVPCSPDEGRLFASLRLLCCVAGRPDLEFMITDLSACRSIRPGLINLPRKHRLPYGSVTDIWQPTNLAYHYFSMGGFFETEYQTIRNSFAADGDLYGHDAAILYTRSPIIIIIGQRQSDRFMCFQPDTVIRDTTWLKVKGSVLQGSYIPEMRREDAIRFDKDDFPVELVHKVGNES
ncbi:hypothetical protein KVR01_000126 [Diaporthe batatas]|uniref:uncharacterized protein n=1 Tax=Diaporthe batatas TaxID=748121 RepID=UPI001D053A4E|nr:uncharacterized protein KVR01_000126 [Diaporthe batatas]KAG8169381.1 hypothetical protein KVR01_000126 [Diaporthe batatas]